MRLAILAAVAASSLLTACQTVEEMAMEDAAICESFGAPIGTQAHFQCRMVQQQRRDAISAQNAAALQSAIHGVNRGYYY